MMAAASGLFAGVYPLWCAPDDRAIDVLHFHWWNFSDTRYVDALAGLSALQDAGKIRHIALTNFDAAHLRIVVASGLPNPTIFNVKAGLPTVSVSTLRSCSTCGSC